MPNKVDDFVPYKLLLFVEDRLRLISKALGYNCDLAVFWDWDSFEESSAKYKVFFDSVSDDTTDNFVGDSRMTQSETIQVFGVVDYETERPRRAAMKLEQDVRTALHTGFSDLRTYTASGCSARFGRSTHDGGHLSPMKRAGFELPITFKWSQDSDW